MNKSPAAVRTIEALQVAIRLKGDLPCLSTSLAHIVDSMKNLDANENDLVNVVLSDFSLSQKVLRLANSPMYAAFGGVTTITMALYVLGTEAIGHLAMGVKLLDNLGQAAETETAREELTKAVISGAVARSVAVGVSGKEGEAVAVATLMRALGRLMVCFYLPEQFSLVPIEVQGISEDDASRKALGLSYGDIASELAVEWNLPAALTESMREPGLEASPHTLWVHSVAGYARGYVDAVARGASETELAHLADMYSDGIGLSSSDLTGYAASAVAAAESEAGTPGIRDNRRRDNAAARTRADKLQAGIDEIDRNQRDLPVSQLVSMATEVLWESLECRNAMFFLHNGGKGAYELILARGERVQGLVRKVSFEAAFSPNVVHLALANAKPVYLSNPQEPNIARRIPDWLSNIVTPARALFLLPVSSNGKSNSVLCLDWGLTAPAQTFTAEEQRQIERLTMILSACLERAVAARVRTTVPA